MFQYPLSVKAKQSTDFEQYWRMAHCFVFCRIVICTISSCNQCAYALLVVGGTVTCSTAALHTWFITARPSSLSAAVMRQTAAHTAPGGDINIPAPLPLSQLPCQSSPVTVMLQVAAHTGGGLMMSSAGWVVGAKLGQIVVFPFVYVISAF